MSTEDIMEREYILTLKRTKHTKEPSKTEKSTDLLFSAAPTAAFMKAFLKTTAELEREGISLKTAA